VAERVEQALSDLLFGSLDEWPDSDNRAIISRSLRADSSSMFLFNLIAV
jgi:hypothetical protein